MTDPTNVKFRLNNSELWGGLIGLALGGFVIWSGLKLKLGTINDLILNQNGEVAAVVIGVGGFLGIGEKNVAVDFSALQWVVAADNTERFVLETNVETLTSAPDFQVVDDNPADGSSTMDAATSSSAQ